MFYLFHWFRSFLPLHNPIGFGGSDFITLAFGAALLAAAFAWKRWKDAFARFARRPGWCLLALFLAPIVLRLALLPLHPVPTPLGSDDFSYLLLGDTLAHFRLANPVHPMHRFFETIFVLQEPSYSSIYPLGPALALAFGKLVFGLPWAGVAISIGIFCALCYWMLLAWTTPEWALAGGILAVIEFGPLNHWMNSYWGGGVAAVAGCMIFGAAPRLRSGWRARHAVILGLGVGLAFLSRPYETVFLSAAVVVLFLPALFDAAARRRVPAAAALAVISFLPAVALVFLQDKAVSGEWTKMPYMLSREQYGVPTSFTTERNPVPQRKLTHEQDLVAHGQAWVHGPGMDSLETWLARLPTRLRFYRFFLLTPLYLALPFFALALKEFRFQWVLLTIALVAVGSNFYVYFFPHYIAAEACLMVLIAITALERMSRVTIRGVSAGADAALLVGLLTIAHFVFWYGLHASANEKIESAMWRYETWDTINGGDPDGRIAIARELAEQPGKQLVFVRYGPQHVFTEWVYNGADIDAQRVVWARDLGAAEDEALRSYYPDRKAWLFEADAVPLKLTPYGASQPAAVPAAQETAAPAPQAPAKSRIQLKFEPVK
ncbi:MAG TPA: hypothetical protein VMG40_04535 [Bryobacteraceae bacterium]|nr:hypothetical protein [Bryobacteraceae bacterium]